MPSTALISPTSEVRIWISFVPVEQLNIQFCLDLAKLSHEQRLIDSEPWFIMSSANWTWLNLFYPTETGHCRCEPLA